MKDGINPNIIRKKRPLRTLEAYLRGLTEGDRYILSEVLTIIEKGSEETAMLRQALLEEVKVQDSSNTVRIGVTGSPGAGKSTLIEQLGLAYITAGSQVAVLAVDPSSIRTDGSILGDKTRMPLLSNHPKAYIRPTASATHLGGVSRTTQESIAMCEKAGFDIVIVESVGVGQSEVELVDLVDVYALVLLPGGGDDVQGIKRGVVEMADLLVINKADGDSVSLAKRSKKDFSGSVDLFPHRLTNWKTPVLLTSALNGEGIDDLVDTIDRFVSVGKSGRYFRSRREEQAAAYLKARIHRLITEHVENVYNTLSEQGALPSLASENTSSVYKEVHRIMDSIASQLNK